AWSVCTCAGPSARSCPRGRGHWRRLEGHCPPCCAPYWREACRHPSGACSGCFHTQRNTHMVGVCVCVCVCACACVRESVTGLLQVVNISTGKKVKGGSSK